MKLTEEMMNELQIRLIICLNWYTNLINLDQKIKDWLFNLYDDNYSLGYIMSAVFKPWIGADLAYPEEDCYNISENIMNVNVPKILNNLNQLSRVQSITVENETIVSKNGYEGFDLNNQDGQFSGTTIETNRTNPENLFKGLKIKVKNEITNVINEILNNILITIW